MGEVYLAQDTKLNRKVPLKILRSKLKRIPIDETRHTRCKVGVVELSSAASGARLQLESYDILVD